MKTFSMENNRIPRALFRSEILVAPIIVPMWMLSCAGWWWYPNQRYSRPGQWGTKDLASGPSKPSQVERPTERINHDLERIWLSCREKKKCENTNSFCKFIQRSLFFPQ